MKTSYEEQIKEIEQKIVGECVFKKGDEVYLIKYNNEIEKYIISDVYVSSMRELILRMEGYGGVRLDDNIFKTKEEAEYEANSRIVSGHAEKISSIDSRIAEMKADKAKENLKYTRAESFLSKYNYC